MVQRLAGLAISSLQLVIKSCNITCPIDGKNFSVTVLENECITKDEDEWASLGA